MGRLVNNMLRWDGHAVRTGDKRWPDRIMTCSTDGRRGRGLAEVKWERKLRGYGDEEEEVERVG